MATVDDESQPVEREEVVEEHVASVAASASASTGVEVDHQQHHHPHDDLLASVGLAGDEEDGGVAAPEEVIPHSEDIHLAAADSELETGAGGSAAPAILEQTQQQQQQQQPSTVSTTNATEEEQGHRNTVGVAAVAVWEPAELDVLTGRGAMVNAHLGNKKFRSLCFARKLEFDNGNHAVKRRVAIEIVKITQQTWGSRFLTMNKNKSAFKNTNSAPSNKATKTDGSADKKSPKEQENVSAMDQNDAGSAQLPVAHGRTTIDTADNDNDNNKGMWYEMTTEQAIQKACQVIRDHKRPDRLSRGGQNAGTANGAIGGGSTTPRKKNRATATPALEEDVAATLPSFAAHSTTTNHAKNPGVGGTDTETPYGVHDHDILCGRGAFVNGHTGNQRLRTLATQRKAQFERGNYTEKRALATEIVMHIRNLDPPGRFLRKIPKTTGGGGGGGDTITTTSNVMERRASQDGATVPPGDTSLLLWEELSDERAIHKACQVMRDMDRLDRKDREERKKLRLLKKEGKLPATPLPMPPQPSSSTSPTSTQGHASTEAAATTARSNNGVSSESTTAVAAAAAAAAAAASASSVEEAVAEAMDKALEAANQQQVHQHRNHNLVPTAVMAAPIGEDVDDDAVAI